MADKTTGDVVDILTADHREMLELIDQIENTKDPAERRALADAVTAEVVRHSVAEELFVYPVMERELPNGAEEVEHDKQEHKELEVILKKLEGADAADTADSGFMNLVAELKKQLNHHVDDEESDQFPKLRKHVSAAALKDLGSKVEAAKTIAPTRPHPGSPNSELFHMTLGPGVGMVDRLRDALSGRIRNT